MAFLEVVAMYIELYASRPSTEESLKMYSNMQLSQKILNEMQTHA